MIVRRQWPAPIGGGRSCVEMSRHRVGVEVAFDEQRLEPPCAKQVEERITAAPQGGLATAHAGPDATTSAAVDRFPGR